MQITRRDFVKMGALAPLAWHAPGISGRSFLSAWKDKPLRALYRDFRDPLPAARPFVRWWWNGERIVEKELLRELDLLREQGISGVEINSIEFPQGDDPMGYQACDWLSDEWLRLLRVTTDGARERGMTCDIIMGSGWPFGGTFLEKDEQIQLMALGTRALRGPATVRLPRKALLDDLATLKVDGQGWVELAVLRLVPADMAQFDPGTDLSPQAGEEMITVEVPAGDHILYYLGKLTGFTVVTHGAPGASGPVLNHYHQQAVKKYLDRMSDAIQAKWGGMGNRFRSVFIDSLELHGSNWTDDMATQFSARRGYDLMPYLPFILFKIARKTKYNGNHATEPYGARFSDTVQREIERVRYDFERTRLELFDERFLNTFLDWCRAQGVKSRVQAYGREYFPLASSMKLDIPECETWLRADVGGDLPENTFGQGRAYRPVNKWVSSAARLTGKREVSCEEQTNTSLVFNASLERIKVTGDQSNLSGVTHSILHGFNYSPPEIPFPGWVRYGTFFNERNPWWPYLRRWIDYKARLSQLFLDAELQSDIAILFPLADLWSRYGVQYQQYPQTVYPPYADNLWEAIAQCGSGCDYVDESILRQATFFRGGFRYGPRSYRVLLLPRVTTLAPETAEALGRFVASGGKLICLGEWPSRAPGRMEAAVRDKQVADTMARIRSGYPANAILADEPSGPLLDWYGSLQARCGLAPFVRMGTPVTHVSQVHYKAGDADIFFLSNYHLEKPHAFTAAFRTGDKIPWVWDPETGEKYRYPYSGKRNVLDIRLDPAQSLLLVFSGEKKGPLFPWQPPADSAAAPLMGPWQLTLEKVYGTPEKRTLPTLIDLKEDPRLRAFAGVIRYEKSFPLTEPGRYRYLDLGKVAGISEVTLNGQSLGVRWYGRHVYPLGGAAVAGHNRLEVKITTVLGNYAKSLKENPVAQSWTARQPLYPLGMIGPVVLVEGAPPPKIS